MDELSVRAWIQEEIRNSPLDLLVRQTLGLIVPVVGVPTVAPGVDRAIGVDLTGAAGSILYVWDGSTWTAFA